MAYEIYINHGQNRAIIHDATCSTLRQHGGVSDPRRQEYSGVIETWDESAAKALSYGKRETRTHSVCLKGVILSQ